MSEDWGQPEQNYQMQTVLEQSNCLVKSLALWLSGEQWKFASYLVKFLTYSYRVAVGNDLKFNLQSRVLFLGGWCCCWSSSSSSSTSLVMGWHEKAPSSAGLRVIPVWGIWPGVLEGRTAKEGPQQAGRKGREEHYEVPTWSKNKYEFPCLR